MTPANPITDYDRSLFLEALIKSDAALTDWEKQFVRSYRQFVYHVFFNAGNGGRRKSADAMWVKYADVVNMPFPVPAAPAAGQAERFSDADPTGCEFLVYENGRRCCNQPATKQRRNGFRYCDPHADQVIRDVKRRGKVMPLLPFKKGTP